MPSKLNTAVLVSILNASSWSIILTFQDFQGTIDDCLRGDVQNVIVDLSFSEFNNQMVSTDG